ncbi:hypothetical protein DICPUDRAFT_82634 [Dictyostelium purpureum]|uniref:RING-type domain-containing protein n=1 Tax=Dictyostelium purpureum TaxID=5786 RepID=F0ZX40_DICPU|nr:uncharacterized protein DICPUDRAFT_82634 [Dictyostelium purpureum]EGC31476.1 hypothetical protein DICPUDRAFT_82634 [Dictyostelium purpureum]|eukprot:XP_003291981.1 hypothetical protein DICPUDRAFT_82634 [Dictyostelium purpureum]
MIGYIVLFILLSLVLGFLSGFLSGYVPFIFSTNKNNNNNNNNNRNNIGKDYLHRYNTYIYPQQTTPIFYTAPSNRPQPSQNQISQPQQNPQTHPQYTQTTQNNFARLHNQQDHQQQQQKSSQHNPFSRAKYYHNPSNNQSYGSDIILTTGAHQQHPQSSEKISIEMEKMAEKERLEKERLEKELLEQKQKDNVCNICYFEVGAIYMVTLGCNHKLCLDCIYKWSKNCPFCRKKITSFKTAGETIYLDDSDDD